MEHTISKEIALEMREFGFEQESRYYWNYYKSGNFGIHTNKTTDKFLTEHPDMPVASAYTLTELMEMVKIEYGADLIIVKFNGVTKDFYRALYKGVVVRDTNPCNALARLLIQIKKEGK